MIYALFLPLLVSALTTFSRLRRAASRRLGWIAVVLFLPTFAVAAPAINTPGTAFTAAEAGRTFMTVGGVWNGTTEVTNTTGDTLSVTFTNSGDATAFDIAPRIVLPTGFTRVGSIVASASSGSPVVTGAPGTTDMIDVDLNGYDLPAGATLTLTYGLKAATTVASGTYQIAYNRNYSLTEAGGLVGYGADAQQNVLVQAGDTTINITPKQQLKAVGENASFTVTITNTGLGGLFDVTLNDSSVYPTGNNLQFVSLTKTAPALAASSSNGGSVLTLPYLAPGEIFTADVVATVLNCGSIVNTVVSAHRANAVPVTDSAPVQLNLLQPLVAYTPANAILDYNTPVNVSYPINNTGLGSAYNFTLQTTLNSISGLTVSNVAAGWTYNSSNGLFTYTANSGTIANGASVTLSYDLSLTPADICSSTGAGTVSYVALYTNGCGDSYTIPLKTSSVAVANNTPGLSLSNSITSPADPSRIAITESGTYTLTLSAANITNIADTNIVVTDTLPDAVTYLDNTPSIGTVNVVGQVVTWTVPTASLSSSQTLTIDFAVANIPCNAGTQPTATATTSATSVRNCPLNASANISFFASNNPGLAASQYFNVSAAPDGFYETGNATADLVRDAGEGEFIPFVASYTFGAAYPGTWAGSTYTDAFGGVTGMVLIPGTLTVTLDGGSPVAVPGGSVTTLTPGFTIDLSFLVGAGYFNDANVAGHTVVFNYKTNAPDSALGGGSSRSVTQITSFVLAGAGGTTSGGCNTPLQSTFTQGAFYSIGRAAASVGINMSGALEVCKEETLTLNIGNGNAKDARNIFVTLNNGAAFTYNPAQTPVYGGAFNAGNITYNANGGTSPTFQYTGNPLTASGTIQVKVTRKANGNTALTGFSAKVDYDSSQTQAAGARVYSSTANYAPSSLYKANLAINVTPGSITVTGPTVTYVTYVSNTDAGKAYDSVLSNTLPVGITVNTALTNAANSSYTVSTSTGPGGRQTLTWNLGDIASGQTIPITLVADVGVIPGCSITIDPSFDVITATWGCDAAIYSTLTRTSPTYNFPAGKMQVVHDSTQTVARLCDLGKIVVIVKNTGPTNIQGVMVSEVIPTSAISIVPGSVTYSINGTGNYPAGNPAGTGTLGDPYVWTSAQISELAELVPVGVSGTNQIDIKFDLAATEALASQNPVLSASATATISCGNAVTSPAQPFTIPIERPSINVTKTGRNITANPAAAFTGIVYGGYTDDVEWKIIITNNGTATAANVRLSDPLSGSGGAAFINGPGLAVNTPFTSGLVIALPDIAANDSVTYTISETLGNNCLTASRTADVTWGCTNNGTAVRSNVSTPGSPTSAATIAMDPVILSGSELTQSFTYLNGGRAKVTVSFLNDGGTAYAPVITATIPAGSTLDTTGVTTFTSGNASITGVTRTGTATSPIFTFTGPASPLLVRYGETVTVSYYVRPTVFDTTNATSFTTAVGSNLVTPETTLDPTPPATANITAKLDYTTSCGSAQSSTNTTSYDPRTPDLDINLTYPGDVLLTDTSAANYVFTITNNGDSGSVADFITLDLPGLGTGWTINSITLTTAGSGGTNGATISSGGAFTPAQVGTLAQGASAVVTVNAQYSGSPGPLTLVLRARGESRGQDGTTANGDYSLDQGGRRVIGVILSKTLQSTSETTTSDPNVLIGEEATFRIRADFFGTEGNVTNLTIRDTPADVTALPTGLAYVSHSYTASNEIVPDTVTPKTPVTPPTSSDASLIDFHRDTLTPADVNGSINTFESDIVFRVLNIAGNTDAKILPNNLGVSFTYLGQTFRSNVNDGLSGTVTSAGLHKATSITVHRPSPAITKSVRNVTRSGAFASSAPGQAGDVVEYKVIVTNPVGTERPLYDLSVTDLIPAKINLSASNVGADTDGTFTTIEVANTAGTSGLGATLVFDQTNTALPTAGSNFTRLDPGQSITLLYRGTLDGAVTPTEVLSNSASIRGYSLPLPSGNQSAFLGTENTETGPTRYNVTATAATVVIDNITQTKTLEATSDPTSTGNNVFFGEQLRYRLTVQLPQGTIPGLIVRDVLPSGLALVSTPAVTIGSAISTGTQPTISPAVPADGPTAIWNFGARTVAADTVANRTITIEYIAQVRNIAATAAGATLVNAADYTFSGAAPYTTVPSVTVTVQAPSITVTRGARNFTRNPSGSFVTTVASNATDSPDAGDVIEYRVTITNANTASTSGAFDFNITDTIPTGMIFVSGSTSVTTSTGLTGTLGAPDVSGQVVTWGRTQASPVNLDLAKNGTLTFTYRATVDDTSKPVQTYTNALVVDWTSLDGDPAVNPTLGVALDTAGNDHGERIGTGTAPNTFRSALNVPIISRNSTTVTKAKSADTLPRTAADALDVAPSGFRVGDIVTYTVTAPLQEGTLAALKIKDTLPAGLAFVATTSITPASNAGVPSPTQPFNYTTPIAPGTAPAAGATGAITWDFGTLVNTGDNTVNDTLTVVYTARVVDPSGIAVTPTNQTLSNTATSSYQKADASTLTTAASVAAIIARQPQLTLTKVVASPAIDALGNYVRRPGDTASFTLTVTNTGTAPAYNIELTDTLPDGMRDTAPVLTAATRNGVDVLASQTAPTWDNATGKFVFDLADADLLLPTQTLVLTYTVTIDNDGTPAIKGTTLTNSATINQFFSLPSGDAEAASRRTYAAVGPVTRDIVIGLRIDGSVYADAQPNNAKDIGEDWSGTDKPTVYANLVTTGGSPIVFRTVQVDAGTGLFAFDYLPPVGYTIVITNSATGPAGLTAARPRNWLFQSPTTGSIATNLVGATADITDQDLGLNQGSYAAPIIDKAKSGATLPTAAPVNGYRIGDLVTYTVDVNPQEGGLTSFAVTDTLPAGLAFNDTVSIAALAPTAVRYTFTTPSGVNTPALGATGAITWTFINTFTNAISGPVNNSTPSAIATNNTLRITYRARVIASGTGNIAPPAVDAVSTDTLGLVNSANVGYTNPAPISAAATAGPATVSLDVSQPRLTVAKVLLSPALNRIAPNGTGQFQVTVTNNGTAPTYNIKLTDTLPVGMLGTAPSLVSTTIDGAAVTVTPVWTALSGTYVFTLGDAQVLQPGKTFVATYTFTVDSTATRGATLTNSATVNQYFSLPANDSQAASRRTYAAVGPATADVIVGISVSGFVYSDIQPNNAKDVGEGWSGATKPDIYVNLLSGGSVYASVTVTSTPGTGAFSFTNLPAGPYELIATDSATSTTATRPLNWPFQTPSTGTISFTLSSADLIDQNIGFFQGSLANPIITKTESGDTLPLSAPATGFRIGDLVTYTIDIQPQEGALTSFQVTDTLPAGLAFVATTSIAQVSGPARFTYTAPVDGSTGPTAAATGAIVWDFGAFTNDALGMADNTLRITYTARIVDSGGIATPAASPATTSASRVNSAGVSYTKPAPDGGAKSSGPATSTISVEQPRLVIAKTRLSPIADNIVMPGATAQFRLTVTNNGTGPAYDAVVTDTLPAGLRTATPVLNAATLNGVDVLAGITPSYNSGTGAWTVTLTDAQILLPADQTLVLDYTVTVDAAATKGSVLTNSALVSSYASKDSTDTTERRVYPATSPSSQNLIVGIQVDGSVYHQLIPNGVKDVGTEDWTSGTPVIVNLVTNDAINYGGYSLGANQVIRSIAVPVGAGDFSFTNVPSGTYRIIVTNTAVNTAASVPSGWTFDTPATGAITPLAITNANVTDQNLGLYEGRTISGRVYNDAAPFGTRESETWASGTPVVVNLVNIYGAPVVYASQAVPAGTGLYSFTNVPPGSYRLVVAQAGETTSTAAHVPATWVFVNPADGTRDNLTLTTTDLTSQDFGLTPGRTVSGFVYNDTNPNSVKDGFEDWLTGTPVVVNLVNLSNGTVFASANVGLGSGAYSFSDVPPGNFRIIITNAAGSTSVTTPASWLFRAPADGAILVTVAGSDFTNQNFGLFRGRTARGVVYRDDGSGGATPNDGIRQGTESGLGGVTVRLLSGSFTVLDTAFTDGAGNFTLHIPADTADGDTLVVEEVNPPAHLSTGGKAGSAGGAYVRATDRITFLFPDDDVTGLEFGDVPSNALLTDGAQTILPGATAYYTHTYIAGSGGSVTFTTGSTLNPSIPWTRVLVRDLNANGLVDAGEPIIDGVALTVSAGQEIALVLKDNSPSNAPNGATSSTVITAAFTHTNANPSLNDSRTRLDLTTIGTATSAGLQLVKAVDKTIAAPGEVITYTITYTNAGAQQLFDLFIDDRTPAYTVFVSAAAGPLPNDLTDVDIVAPAVDVAGTLRWTFTGTLVPGASGTVTFQVKVK
ncbi:MAG: isopeptide-forming domain-containing fimbrial protein [Opitutaceae bacterium]|jgi:uncharacterized repeat protein (TIGR01451 family)/fimbrial isopeptide formation D2 family protein